MWSALVRGLANLLTNRQTPQGMQSSRRGSDRVPTPPVCGITGLTASQVSNYLRANQDFLERFVTEEVELEQLERWLIRRSQQLKRKEKETSSTKNNNSSGRKTSLSRWKFCVHADKRQMLLDLTHSLQLKPTKDHVLWELANCICSAVNADGFRLYIAEHSNAHNLFLYQENSDNSDISKKEKAITGKTVPTYVARTREAVRLSRNNTDNRFPNAFTGLSQAAHLQCQAVLQPDGQLVAVLELWRKEGDTPFYEEDEEIASSYIVWGGVALHYAELYFSMNQQRRLNDFLLAVVKSIFQDMVSMDILVTKIMNFAQRLVDADRASLFLLDSKNKELYATIFDVGLETSRENVDDDSEENAKKASNNTSKEIRFPLGTGIAGQVAMTGEVLNITDAYADERFNRTVDQLTGYRTRTILCMPIFIRGSIIGVVQMVNKRTGSFTKDDEQAFEMFAVYCGLALHHAKLYDKIRKSEQKYKVALEVLSYHNSCTEDEVETVQQNKLPEKVEVLIDDYYFNPFQLEDYEKAGHAIYMFTDLFGLSRFDKQSLLRFTLTVKKNYRRVPYHNWAHGFSVANCMYTIIKHSGGVFQTNEGLALYIGSLCHDLDHRGKNNKFMLESASPIAAIYSTSTMEHHHFNQTVTILQQEGHNIFAKLSNSEYKQMLGLLKHCILATDLALFFPNKAKLTEIVEQKAFSWDDEEHRLLLLAISMTSSDLCASAKPWDIQTETVKVIFEEFYQQGDAERAAGRQPIPMMDRYQPDQQAASQVGFLTGICIPCYTLLYTIIPETKPLLDKCNENLRRWQEIDREVQEKKKLGGDI
ncbi:probable 3',5'-cyclic phosphodiesterase pde-5 isoform X2 [Agrilus planipennis]|uniref:Phosphodiesterase n=1 Tax=Agrilus planipennis TaxID=224129 RepID=A0A1W4WYY5_AGRPL|nr:probable 3',5'-cyclic phosphodiesterase pde-5 isoform X2 [Agrilus planipennis]XP_018325358.1 probable 3',5'-cyclic phosphodiesterase pde-5 isoform X2 [Agrilus planipennis]